MYRVHQKYNWIPIGRDYLPYDSYDGIFDGAGYSISGLYGSNIEFYLGLFGKVHNGTIKKSFYSRQLFWRE